MTSFVQFSTSFFFIDLLFTSSDVLAGFVEFLAASNYTSCILVSHSKKSLLLAALLECPMIIFTPVLLYQARDLGFKAQLAHIISLSQLESACRSILFGYFISCLYTSPSL
jgi:hypothetical protein